MPTTSSILRRPPPRRVAAAVLAFGFAAGLAPTALTQVGPLMGGGYAVVEPSRSAQYASFQVPAIQGVAPSVQVQPVAGGWCRVHIVWQLTAQVQVDDVAVAFDLDLDPTFHWIPHLSPAPTTIVAQHLFRAPAIVVAEGRRSLAIIPDVALCGIRADAPWYLDYDATLGRAWVGLSESSLPVHVLFGKAPGMTLAPGAVELGFYVKAWEDGANPANPWAEPAKFLWDAFGAPEVAAGRPTDHPLTAYVEQAYDWAFQRWARSVWRESLDGRMGGTQIVVDFSQSPSRTVPPIATRPDEVWNQAWFSNLRTASGLYRWARRFGDDELGVRAEQMKELALAAPQVQGGIFPAVAQLPGLQRGNYFDADEIRWTNSNRVPTELGITRSWYHVLDASETCLWMLRLYDELDADPRLLHRVRSYADWLLTQQRRDGFFPAWLHPRTLAPAPVLQDSPETARSASLLLELYRIKSDPKYLRQGLAALDAVLRGPVPEGRWEDFETYWSDNRFGTGITLGMRFPRNGMYKQNNLSMFWVAEAALRAWELTGRAQYLAWGQRTLDELSMTQTVWQPQFMHVPVVGGFGVMNADGEWNDARQSLFAELFLEYYRATGDRRYFERGVAALEASFSMMFTPLNPEATAQWNAAFPSLTTVDHGFQMENYGHWGQTSARGDGMGFFAIFDWGAGSASEAVGRILDHWGDVYIDRGRGEGFGLNQVDVTAVPGGGWQLTDRAGVPRRVRIVYASGVARSVMLNGSVQIP